MGSHVGTNGVTQGATHDDVHEDAEETLSTQKEPRWTHGAVRPKQSLISIC